MWTLTGVEIPNKNRLRLKEAMNTSISGGAQGGLPALLPQAQV
jgi:hypothetical protein